MIKKFLVTLMLLFYMMPTFGINVTIHYCGGKVSYISYGAKEVKLCACGIKKMKKNCCQNKKISIQVDVNQIQAQQISSIFPSSSELNATCFPIDKVNFFVIPIVFEGYFFHHPPNKVIPSLCIFNQVFRI